MAAKKKAAKAGAGAYAAGKAVRSNEYVQRLVEDQELRENLRSAFVSAKKAYGRVNGKGPAKALDDKKVQRELKDAATSLKEAADTLRGQKKRKRRKGRLLVLGLVGAGLALALSEGLRKKVLDAPVWRRGGVRVHGEHHAGVELQLDDQRKRAGERNLVAHANRLERGRPAGRPFSCRVPPSRRAAGSGRGRLPGTLVLHPAGWPAS